MCSDREVEREKMLRKVKEMVRTCGGMKVEYRTSYYLFGVLIYRSSVKQ